MKLDLLIEEVSIERTESRTLLEAFQPYACHRESCKFLKMEVDRLEIELESLRQKRALADRCEKLRESYANDRLDWAGLDPHWTGAKPGMAQPPPSSYQGPGRPVRLRHELEEALYEERFSIQMERCNSDAASLEREIGRLQVLYTKWSRVESAWAKVKRRSEEERLYGMTREDFLGVVCRRITAAENEASRVARRRTDLMKEEMQQLASSERTERVQAYQREAEAFHRQTVNRHRQEEEKERRESEAAAAAEEERKDRELHASWERKERALAFRTEVERQRFKRNSRPQEQEEDTSDSEASEMQDFLRDPIAAARKVGLIPMEDDEQREAQALDSFPATLTVSPASPDDHPDNGVGLGQDWNNAVGEVDSYEWLTVHQPERVAQDIEDAMKE